MYNYKIVLQYDGSRYDGWQRLGRDESVNTIEYKIVEILKKMSGEEVELHCGCRTEKGVHAYGQVANFKLNTEYEEYEIRNYLNRYLPRDIAVLEAHAVDDRFHSQLNAKAKTYIYRLDTKSIANVFTRKYCYHTFELPDFSAMQKAAAYMTGSHDFKAFTTAKRSKSTVKRVDSIQISEQEGTATIAITANDFLHNQARLMIGLLLEVGNGNITPQNVKEIMDGTSEKTWLPAESYGLFLQNVLY